jgi:hypothetical protein
MSRCVSWGSPTLRFRKDKKRRTLCTECKPYDDFPRHRKDGGDGRENRRGRCRKCTGKALDVIAETVFRESGRSKRPPSQDGGLFCGLKVLLGLKPPPAVAGSAFPSQKSSQILGHTCSPPIKQQRLPLSYHISQSAKADRLKTVG